MTRHVRKNPFPERMVVLWYGPSPASELKLQIQERGLALHVCATRNDVFAHVGEARGVIIAGATDTVPRMLSVSRPLIRHGILLHVLAADDGDRKLLAEATARSGVNSWTEIGRSPVEAIEDIRRHDPGPPRNDNLVIRGDKPSDDEQEQLLRRAFFDCSHLTLHGLPGGRGSEAVFEVQAELREQQIARFPMPYFAKFAPAEKWKRECDHYDSFATPFVPFHARPNLDPARCVRGVRTGLLVGNFVEESEPLSSCVRRGGAHSVIYSLFDRALRGWRLQGLESPPVDEPLVDNINRFADVNRVAQATIARAASMAAGFNMSDLVQAMSPPLVARHRRGIIHGDLHSENIRVRGNDAILIDFYAAGGGALALDPASIEVSFAFCDSREETTTIPHWRELVDALYGKYLFGVPPPPRHSSSREWLLAAVRQIRLLTSTSSASREEYPVALALAMVRRAGHLVSTDGDDPDVAEARRRRHAYLLPVALRILNGISAGRGHDPQR